MSAPRHSSPASAGLQPVAPSAWASEPTSASEGPVTTAVTILPEPELEFRHGQRATDPHAGLALFGPYDSDSTHRPTRIAYGLIGAPEGVSGFARFAARMADPIVSQTYGDPDASRKQQLLWPPWPGFEAAFRAVLPAAPVWSRAIPRTALLEAARHNDKYRRAYDVANLYVQAIRIARERDENFALFICVVPDEVYLNCRPLSKVQEGVGVALSKKERDILRKQIDLFSPYAPEEYDLSVDFRRQLKARVMEFGVPVQLIRESTLRLGEPEPTDTRGLTTLSDRAWNLATAFYYKAGGKPWRLSTAREGVCYVGLAFRRSEIDTDERTACCAAQMFLDTGDGVVFRGEFGPWYSPERDEHHLSPEAAEALLRGVLEAHADLGGARLREIFLHARSTISREEFAGYLRACPPGVRLVGVRVRRQTDGLRLYRPGKWPVLRNTLWVTSPRSAYLWATGFKPTVLSYDGWEVPVPLRLDIEHGEADIVQVARDIAGLTKLNYNTCKLGDAAPVTVGFSDAVGEILIGNPKVRVRLPAFKYYI